ncbi:MAG: hypothetical protein ACR2PK_08890 [Acidimicrobiales bacterium]
MVLAAINDGPYDVVYFLHIISIIIGTGAAFLLPIAATRSAKAGQDVSAIDDITGAVLSPALLLAGVFGGALVGMSDDVYDFGQTWLAFGGLVWLIGVAAAAFAYPPSYLKLPDMSDKKPMLSGVLHLSLVVMLILMTWKPGSPF